MTVNRLSTVAAFIPALAASALAFAAEGPGGDLAQLQGRWTAEVGPGRALRVVLEVEGRRAQIQVRTPQGDEFSVRGALRIDEGARPKALDWTGFSGVDGQDVPEIPAIYEIAGDRLTVRNGGPDGPRPTAFHPGDDPLSGLVVFRRVAGEVRGGE